MSEIGNVHNRSSMGRINMAHEGGVTLNDDLPASRQIEMRDSLDVVSGDSVASLVHGNKFSGLLFVPLVRVPRAGILPAAFLPRRDAGQSPPDD